LFSCRLKNDRFRNIRNKSIDIYHGICYNLINETEGGEEVDDIKEWLEIAKDLLQILVLVLTAGQLVKHKGKSKSKRGK